MIALLLAAGYGTRMRAVSRTVPKSLLPVAGGRVVIDYLVDQLQEIKAITGMVLVTNDLFHEQFAAWARGRGLDGMQILNDGTRCNEDRLGAIGDLQFAIERAGLDDDLLVAGTDNIFGFPLAPLIVFFHEKQAPVIPVLRETDSEQVKKTAELHLDTNGRVRGFVEKPQAPTSELINPPLYIFTRDTLPLVKTFIDSGHSTDSPGRFMAWLHEERAVYGLMMAGGRHDIGSPETYRAAQEAMTSAERGTK